MAIMRNNAPAYSPCDTALLLQGQTQVYKKQPTLAGRSYATQKKSRTVCQAERRAKVKTCINLWLSLSGAQTLAWQTLAASTQFFNSCGEIYHRSTYNMFMTCNMVLIEFGISYLLPDPPASYTPPAAALSWTLQRADFCFYPLKIATLNFTTEAGKGLQVFAVFKATALTSVLLKKGYHLFSNIDGIDPLYGPDAGNPNPLSTRQKFMVAVGQGWEKIKSVYGGSCAPPPVA